VEFFYKEKPERLKLNRKRRREKKEKGRRLKLEKMGF
jgi:hypothetical protein